LLPCAGTPVVPEIEDGIMAAIEGKTCSRSLHNAGSNGSGGGPT